MTLRRANPRSNKRFSRLVQDNGFRGTNHLAKYLNLHPVTITNIARRDLIEFLDMVMIAKQIKREIPLWELQQQRRSANNLTNTTS